MLSPLAGLFFYRSPTSPYMTKNYFSHMVKVILAASLFVSLVIWILKYQKQDEPDRILLLDAKFSDNDDFLLINKEFEQLNTLSTPYNLVDDITDIYRKIIILGRDFNVFFDLHRKCAVEIQKWKINL